MKRMLIVMAVVALAVVNYWGTDPSLRGATDYQNDSEYLTGVGGTTNLEGSVPTGALYLCKEEAAEETAPPAPEEKPSEPVPGIDRLWNVVMYG